MSECQQGNCPINDPYCEGCRSDLDEMNASPEQWAQACIDDLSLHYEVSLENMTAWFKRVLNARCVKGPGGYR